MKGKKPPFELMRTPRPMIIKARSGRVEYTLKVWNTPLRLFQPQLSVHYLKLTFSEAKLMNNVR